MAEYFKPVRHKSKMMWVVQGERGGVIPKELQGQFTKQQFAIDAINAYESRKKNANVSKSSDTRGAGSNRTSRKKASSGDGQETA